MKAATSVIYKKFDQIDVGDIGQAVTSLFIMILIMTSVTIPPAEVFNGQFLLIFVVVALFVANFLIAFRSLKGEKDRIFIASKAAVAHITVGLIVSAIFIGILGKIFEPVIFTHFSVFLTSKSLVAFCAGLSVSAMIDLLKD